jgi:hypothetical protein
VLADFAPGASISVSEANTCRGRLTIGSQTGRVADEGIVARARIGVDAHRQTIAAAPSRAAEGPLGRASLGLSPAVEPQSSRSQSVVPGVHGVDINASHRVGTMSNPGRTRCQEDPADRQIGRGAR